MLWGRMLNPNYGKLWYFCIWGVAIFFLYFKQNSVNSALTSERRGEIMFYLLKLVCVRIWSWSGCVYLHACMRVLYLCMCGATGSVLVLGYPQKVGAMGHRLWAALGWIILLGELHWGWPHLLKANTQIRSSFCVPWQAKSPPISTLSLISFN